MRHPQLWKVWKRAVGFHPEASQTPACRCWLALHCLFLNMEYGLWTYQTWKNAVVATACGRPTAVSALIFFWQKIVWQRLQLVQLVLIIGKFTKVWTWLTSNNFQPWSSHIFWPATLAELWRWEHRRSCGQNCFWSPRKSGKLKQYTLEAILLMLTYLSDYQRFLAFSIFKLQIARYDSFEVLENMQCSHVMFQGLSLNVCTSGASGVMTLSIQARTFHSEWHLALNIWIVVIPFLAEWALHQNRDSIYFLVIKSKVNPKSQIWRLCNFWRCRKMWFPMHVVLHLQFVNTWKRCCLTFQHRTVQLSLLDAWSPA